MSISWRGVFPAVLTQFNQDYSVDLAGTGRHVDALIRAGVHGVIMLGTLGENGSLEYAEKVDILNATIDAAAGRVPVLAGVAEGTTALAYRLARDAQDAGVKGLMVLPAMIYRSDARETVAHFRAVAKATDLPVMVYNNPVSYGVDITPAMFADLADEPRFVAIKESSENVRRITDIKNACGDRYALFCGVDDLYLEAAMLGAVGWVAGLVNAFPAETVRLYELAAAGRFAEAVALYRWFTPLLHLDTHVKLVQYIKLAAAECGFGTQTVRPPRLTLTGAEREQVLGVIRHGIRQRPRL
jgi:1-pyrroline-4-hydroxy-2-carboxylate deaminase